VAQKSLNGKFQGSIDVDQKHGLAVALLCLYDARARPRSRPAVHGIVRGGNDFPDIWITMLKRHPLVDGIPQSKMLGGRAVLEIRLTTGERLLFDGDARRFSLG